LEAETNFSDCEIVGHLTRDLERIREGETRETRSCIQSNDFSFAFPLRRYTKRSIETGG